MNPEHDSGSLADQAAAWVPPWERPAAARPAHAEPDETAQTGQDTSDSATEEAHIREPEAEDTETVDRDATETEVAATDLVDNEVTDTEPTGIDAVHEAVDSETTDAEIDELQTGEPEAEARDADATAAHATAPASDEVEPPETAQSDVAADSRGWEPEAVAEEAAGAATNGAEAGTLAVDTSATACETVTRRIEPESFEDREPAPEPPAESRESLDREPAPPPVAESKESGAHVPAESESVEPECDEPNDSDTPFAAGVFEAFAGTHGTVGDALPDGDPALRGGELGPPDGEPGPPAGGPYEPPLVPTLSGAELGAAIEAILLVIDEPVTEAQLADVLEAPVEDVMARLAALAVDYTESGRGFDLRRAAGGWRLYTRGEYSGYVERFVLDGQSVRLTQAALETVAVIAYQQPVTRSRISAIRGVNCDGVVRTLVTRGLIEECGTQPESGAYLYRTTTLFLEKLGLDSVDQLPPLAPFLPDDVNGLSDAQR